MKAQSDTPRAGVLVPSDELKRLQRERDGARVQVLADVVEMLSTQHTWLTRAAAINLVAGLYGRADEVFSVTRASEQVAAIDELQAISQAQGGYA
jgi:hypothetical protein